ncbi:microsomal triacylglycerol transfer protein [Danaus plexippus]|uniref:microsomal triacylglycerol transfer protein n=1 Tax=Danaus plexippus TaxID=13037 RepID=UPI002AB2B41A|nr:microsomal triacylglycerol transfer protein [Danaus plexippus]
MLSYIVILYCSAILQTTTSSESRADSRQLKLFEEPISYDVESTVLLNELERKEKEVSYKIKAKLNVIPLWTEAGVQSVLKFELLSPHLFSRSKSVTADYLPMNSIWDLYSHSTFYAHWKLGLIETAYLDPKDPVEIQNFKRSLMSVFQFETVGKELNETDVSGTCHVQYETTSANTVRKYKSSCRLDDWPEMEEGVVKSRRLARYTLDDRRHSLRDLHAEELHELVAGGRGGRGGLKARAWLRLTADEAAGAMVPRSSSLAEALSGLPHHVAAESLQAAPVQVTDPLYLEESLEMELEAAISELRDYSAERYPGPKGDEGGEAMTAHVIRRLVRALRAAPLPALVPILSDDHDPEYLRQMCMALGLAGTAHTHATAMRFFRLRSRDAPVKLVHTYLAALALTPQPHESVVEDVLRLAEEMTDLELVESALLAGAAAAAGDEILSAGARHALTKSLVRCKTDECRRVRIAALGNLKRKDTVELLLEHAEAGRRGVALAALDALGGTLAALRTDTRLPRLERLVLRPSPLELRAAALDLLLRCSAEAPFGLTRLMLELHGGAPLELVRLAWHRLHALADDHPHVRNMMKLLPRRLRGWEVQAMAGTSSVLVRELGAVDGWRARLESVQVASGGLLRRGRVHLSAVAPHGDSDDTLAVEFWTRGLEAIAGNGQNSDEEDEEGVEVSGGLALSVGGVRGRSVTLFTGQGELLGHVWASTASEPTPVLRAARTVGASGVVLPLLDGAALRLERDSLQLLALDAAAQVSLWSRSARSQMRLSVALEAAWGARVVAAGARLTARGWLRGAPRMAVEADLDFYDGNVLCVRVYTAGCDSSYGFELVSKTGMKHVWRRRHSSMKSPGRTLSLGRINDSLCRVLTAML